MPPGAIVLSQTRQVGPTRGSEGPPPDPTFTELAATPEAAILLAVLVSLLIIIRPAKGARDE